MTNTPFLALKLGGKKDAVLARQRRRVASLLSFDSHEQACIAAGAFVVACQALVLFGKARLCFQIENHQLQIFAQEVVAASDPVQGRPANHRFSDLLPEMDPKTLFRLTKPLPPQENPAEEIELGWLVNQVEEAACNGLFDEIIKQNQEVLSLLHEVRLFQRNLNQQEENPANPNAA